MSINVFIGSSSESAGLAYALQVNLEGRNEIRPKVWTQGIFQASSFVLDSLREAIEKADFGVFLFAPDDVVLIRGEERSAVRDNVVFELGLFMGTLGRTRTFVVMPRGVDLRMPSDLFGLIPVEYDAEWAGHEPQPALGSAATRISAQVAQLGSKAEDGGPLPAADDPDALRRRHLRAMLEEPNDKWRRLDTLRLAVGTSEEGTRDLLVQVGARGSVKRGGPEVWGLISRVDNAGSSAG